MHDLRRLTGTPSRSLPHGRAPEGVARGGPSLAGGMDGEVGTFKDNKTAPIHRWFQYPAGFSYRAVEHALDLFPVAGGGSVYDPFAGTGTTLVVCKGRGVRSVGVEAHPLVARIARTKVAWEVDGTSLAREAERFLRSLPRHPPSGKRVDGLPELVRKCYSRENLARLLAVRDRLDSVPPELRDLFEVALVGTLRSASAAATGWPYIAPRKRIQEREAYATYAEAVRRCIDDLATTAPETRHVESKVLEADARDPPLPPGKVDLAFTSPPYLNNYDYADRLRLETYFLGMAATWADISERFRSRLVVSATTQVQRRDGSPEDRVLRAVEGVEPVVARELSRKVRALSEVRYRRRGKKNYDLMVARYFEDMTRALAATQRALRPGGAFVLILGDSAPYGVPIPTEEYLGRIGVGTGFRSYQVHPLRERGGKWRSNPQRHHVPLKESWLVLHN